MPIRPLPLFLSLVSLTGLAVDAAEPTGTPVAPGPVLSVPASSEPLVLATELPQGSLARTGSRYQLVALPDRDLTAAAQVIPASGKDGLPSDDARRLAAIVPGDESTQGQRRFHLEGVKPEQEQPFRFDDVSEQSLGLWEGDSPVLVYNHGVITDENVPKKDHRRSRACYVHPLHGLRGEVLTDDFPRDHYHHHGIFWTWPHVKVDGREHSLWSGSSIRQEFVKWLARQTGPVCAVLGVENGWLVGEKKVMIERVWLRAYRAQQGQERVVDLDLFFIPTDSPVTLWGAGGKSYGGLTVRFAPASRQETTITVPDGKTKADLPDTPLAWADFTSRMKGAEHRSGATVMVSPKHPDYPPTWLTRHYGPLCVGWPGVQAKTFRPGEVIRLSYRLWVHKDAGEPDAIRAAYRAYTAAVLGAEMHGPR